MHLDLTTDGEQLLVKYEPREADLLGLVQGLKRHGNYFVAKKSLAIPLQLRALFNDKMTCSEKVNQWGFSERSIRERRGIETVRPEFLQHQKVGAGWLASIKNGLIAHDPGTGKTATAILALNEVKQFPCLVICPNSIKRTWKYELEKWAPDLKVAVVDGTAAQRKKILQSDAQVFITNYESLPTLSHVGRFGSLKIETKNSALNEIPWKVIICDEAHRIINPRAKQTRCVKELARMKSVEYRWALTGTPLSNKPDDFWSILNFLEPDVWVSKVKFLDMFCQMTYNTWGGSEVVGLRPERKQLMADITNLYMDYVNKEDVLPDLPEKTFSTRFVEMKPKQKKQYKALVDDMLIKTEDGSYIIATSPLACLGRLSQAASATLEVDEEGEVILQNPSCKIDALVELAEEMGGQQFVGVASSKKLIYLAAEKLKKEGYQVLLFTGDQDLEERQHNIEMFQAGHAQIILGTIGAIKEGVTLTAASTLVFINNTWSNVEYKQAQDRVHRIGSTGDRVNIIHLVAQDTVEERQTAALARKDGFLQDLLDSSKLAAELITS